MSKRNARDLYNLMAENESQTFFELSDKMSQSIAHTNRLSCFSDEYEKERNFEKTEENQS